MTERTGARPRGLSEEQNNALLQAIFSDPDGKITNENLSQQFGINRATVIRKVNNHLSQHPDLRPFIEQRRKKAMQQHGKVGGDIAAAEGLGMFSIDDSTGQPYTVEARARGRQTVIEKGIGILSQTPEERKKAASMGGIAVRDLGLGAHKLTREQRVNIGKKTLEKRIGIYGIDPETGLPRSKTVNRKGSFKSGLDNYRLGRGLFAQKKQPDCVIFQPQPINNYLPQEADGIYRFTDLKILEYAQRAINYKLQPEEFFKLMGISVSKAQKIVGEYYAALLLKNSKPSSTEQNSQQVVFSIADTSSSLQDIAPNKKLLPEKKHWGINLSLPHAITRRFALRIPRIPYFHNSHK